MIESGAHAPEELRTNICIVGSGPAGMTVALELERLGIGCVLLESGARDPSPDHTRLNESEQIGIQTDISTGNRARGLGGTSNLWLGVCRPLDAVDFERRPWIPESGWPIRLPDIAPYYGLAHRILGLPPPDYDLESLQARGIDPGKSFADRDFHNFIFYRTNPPFRFSARYGSHLESSPRIQTFVDSTVVSIQTDREGLRVESLEVSTLKGRRFRVHASRFILAAGAVQNARLLLTSNGVHQNGIGNQHGMVGRNFLQHPVLFSPRVLLLDPARREELVRDCRLNTVVTTGIKPAVARDHELLNFHFYFRQHTPIQTAREPIHALPEAIRRFVGDPTVVRTQNTGDVAEYFQQIQPVIAPGKPLEPAHATLEMRPEQAPNFESRITLSERRDALGLPLAKIDWRLTELDQNTMKTGLRLLNNRMAWHGIGHIQSTPRQHSYPSANGEFLHGGHHHYGTTRMGDSPRTSVVDENCRIHGVNNLYVAGSGVFPTTGQVNPTLSIVAFSARLADHLAKLEEGHRRQAVATVP